MTNANKNALSMQNTEIQLLGTLMMEPDKFASVADSSSGIRTSDFTLPEARTIWQTMGKLHSKGIPAELPQVIDQLNSDGNLQKAGGMSFLLDVPSSAISSAYLSTYVQVLKEATLRRTLTARTKSMQDAATKEDIGGLISEIKDLADKAEQYYDGGAYGKRRRSTMNDYISEKFGSDLKQFSSIHLRTNFPYLDNMLGGNLYPGTYTLAATSSLGKTTLASQIAENVASQQIPVLYYSIEMSEIELLCKSLNRIVSTLPGNVTTSSLRLRKYWNMEGDKTNCPIPEEEFDAITKALQIYQQKIGQYMMVYGSNFNCTLEDIISDVKDFCKTSDTKPFVVIDYLQIIQKSKDFHGTDQQHVDLCMSALERLAKNEQITILVISSVNRQSYLTPISFESLKASGSIEFSSDVVLAMDLCVMDELDEHDADGKKREIINEEKKANPRRIRVRTLKNRYGVNGETYFYYYPSQDFFRNLEKAPVIPKAEPVSSESWR